MPSLLPPAERRSVVLVTLYAALALALLVVGERLPAAWLRGAGAVVFEPFDRAVLAIERFLTAWRDANTLHARIASLEVEAARLRGMAAENERLRTQLGLPAWKGLPLTPVEVLAFGGEAIPASVTLGTGRGGGARPGDAVLTSDGLVGRVTEGYGRLARAALLTDPELAVAVEVESTGVQGVLRFTTAPRPRLLMTAVPLSDTVLLGQRLVTSELSVRFPRGIPVGRIAAVRSAGAGLLQDIEVEPAARLTRLRHAFLAPGPVEPGSLPRPRLESEPLRIAPAVTRASAPPQRPNARRDSTPRPSASTDTSARRTP